MKELNDQTQSIESIVSDIVLLTVSVFLSVCACVTARIQYVRVCIYVYM